MKLVPAIAAFVLAALALALWLGRGSVRGSVPSPSPSTETGDPPAAAGLRADAAEGRANDEREPLVVSDGPDAEEDSGPDPFADPLVAFHGVFVDALTGSPVAGARALVPGARQSFRPAEPMEVEREAVSDAGGHFQLDLARKASIGVAYALADGYGAIEFLRDRTHDTRERAQTIELLPAAALEILVRDVHGAPMAGVAVECSASGGTSRRAGATTFAHETGHWSGSTGADGRVRFVGLPAEKVLEWSARPEPAGEAIGDRLALAAEKTTVRPGERRRIVLSPR